MTTPELISNEKEFLQIRALSVESDTVLLAFPNGKRIAFVLGSDKKDFSSWDRFLSSHDFSQICIRPMSPNKSMDNKELIGNKSNFGFRTYTDLAAFVGLTLEEYRFGEEAALKKFREMYPPIEN